MNLISDKGSEASFQQMALQQLDLLLRTGFFFFEWLHFSVLKFPFFICFLFLCWKFLSFLCWDFFHLFTLFVIDHWCIFRTEDFQIFVREPEHLYYLSAGNLHWWQYWNFHLVSPFSVSWLDSDFLLKLWIGISCYETLGLI